MSVFRRRSRCWLIDMASSRKKPARRRSRWESLYAVMWFMNSFSGRSGQAFKLDMHAKWRCMPLTWPIGLRVPGASWVFGFFLFFRLFIYLFIYIYIYLKAWRSDGDYVPCQVSPDNASEAMHSTCCSRRLEDIYPSAHTLFFSLFQFSPYLQSPPSGRALQRLKVLHLVDRRSMWVRWSSGILNGHVLRRVGVQRHNYIYVIYHWYLRIPACRMKQPWMWLARPAAHQRRSRSRTPTSVNHFWREKNKVRFM